MEIAFEAESEKQQELSATHGIHLLQLSLILRRYAAAGDVEALQFFESCFVEIIRAGRELLKQKAH